jgi:hypothetical protein
MKKTTIDAETILKRAAPLTHQQAHETQPFGHLVKMPLALSANACKESVDNLIWTPRVKWRGVHSAARLVAISSLGPFLIARSGSPRADSDG